MAPAELADQAALLGVPAEAVAPMMRRQQRRLDEVLEVMPGNWGAVRVFFGMGSQWRRAGMVGVATGLDYAALPVVCGALSISLDAGLLARLRVLEGEAVRVMAERSQR